nr:MAG TPA: hypothetical protein [Caudoviricetes sp.]
MTDSNRRQIRYRVLMWLQFIKVFLNYEENIMWETPHNICPRKQSIIIKNLKEEL